MCWKITWKTPKAMVFFVFENLILVFIISFDQNHHKIQCFIANFEHIISHGVVTFLIFKVGWTR